MSDITNKHPDTSSASLPPLTNAAWLHTKETQLVLKMLEDAGYEARVVGGAVRNALMGADVADLDIATTAKPKKVAEIANANGLATHPTGIDHGTVTIIANHKPFEVTTLRRDVSTDGRRATVAFTTNWKEDAERRDFTINALYCDRHGNIYDPLGNAQDLIARKIRFIGDADERIREDYLRILRFFRFFATYANGAPDEEGLTACARGRDGLHELSGERIQAELFRILVTRRARDAVSTMDAHHIFKPAIGQPVSVCTFGRTIDIEEKLRLPPDPVRRLITLTAPASRDSNALSQRLRLSNSARTRIALANNHADDFASHLNDNAAKILLYKLGQQTFCEAGIVSWARSNDPIEQSDRHHALKLPRRWQPPPLPVSGADVMNLGVPAGPQVGNILDTFETWWLEAGFPEDLEVQTRKLTELVALTKR